MTSPSQAPKNKIVSKFFKAITAGLTKRYTAPPQGVEPVSGFEPERYLGRWYEIKRLDHSFERNATRVYAEYSLRDDGKIKVVNTAYSTAKQDWVSIEGYARFQGDPNIASLSVTFFWPITAGYHVIDLDHDNYQWALVTGPSRDYLWILARKTTLPTEITERLTNYAKELGYDISTLIDVDHS
ncbi:lipocalin family protein [Halorhodospira halochloris]|uniref:lipocalin family protein n=1 Tax=Halorhodospira halochloris TaxID=1052 RepID=UPI001EE78D84|nr:lipocalin family protein [Halorhodospira halochloris]MCG5547756.1 lipocalin family protein [Halorhodospira halochloris]